MKHLKSYSQLITEEKRLRKGASLRNREEAAADPETRESDLEILSSDPMWQVRANVAGNPRTPVDLLINLAGDESATVRSVAAANPNLPVPLIIQLGSREELDEWVRRWAAKNPSLPLEDRIRILLRLRIQSRWDPDSGSDKQVERLLDGAPAELRAQVERWRELLELEEEFGVDLF
jgi:hypothetical protein